MSAVLPVTGRGAGADDGGVPAPLVIIANDGIADVERRLAADAPGRVSPIEFRLDLGSGAPPYLHLVHQVEHALRLGSLALGDQLPKVRDVVANLAINPNTVSKAYRELETKGLAVGRPGPGTFIVATVTQVVLPEPRRAPALAGLLGGNRGCSGARRRRDSRARRERAAGFP